jgi:hypothetical protein
LPEAGYLGSSFQTLQHIFVQENCDERNIRSDLGLEACPQAYRNKRFQKRDRNRRITMSKNETLALLNELINVEELEQKIAPSGQLGVDE